MAMWCHWQRQPVGHSSLAASCLLLCFTNTLLFGLFHNLLYFSRWFVAKVCWKLSKRFTSILTANLINLSIHTEAFASSLGHKKVGFRGNIFCNGSNCVAQATQFDSEWPAFSDWGRSSQFTEKAVTYLSLSDAEQKPLMQVAVTFLAWRLNKDCVELLTLAK